MSSQTFLSFRTRTRRPDGGLLRRRDRLAPLFVLRGHLLAVLAHLLMHRLGTRRLAAARELPHHPLAVLAHLPTNAWHRLPQPDNGADGEQSNDCLLHHRLLSHA